MEVLFVLLPQSGKTGQRTLVDRDHFTKSGESTNFSRSYTGVPFRNLVEIPRMTDERKKEILGTAAVGAFTRQRVEKEVRENGHPLMWGEWKPVQLFSTLYRDFRATEINDFTPGSGAAALAAIYNEIPYQGFCHNPAHLAWLDAHLQQLYVAAVGVGKRVKVDETVKARVTKFLHRAVAAAKDFLPEYALCLGELAEVKGDDHSDEADA